MDNQQIMTTLASCEFFQDLIIDSLQNVADLCLAKSYEAGEYFFKQGDFGEHIYIIVEGQVVLERSVDLYNRKGRVSIETLGKGRVLGCWSTLLGQPHILMSSALCQKPTIGLILKGADLRDMMLTDNTFGFHIMEKLCFLLRDRIQAAYGAMEKI